MRVKLDAGATAPNRAYANDAGLDLYAMHGGIVRAHQSATFHTGVRVEAPPNTAVLLQPKSGLMVHHDILTFGVIDESYRGEILVHMFNLGADDYNVRAGDKISQMLLLAAKYEPVEVVDELSDGERGQRGFGSSGR